MNSEHMVQVHSYNYSKSLSLENSQLQASQGINMSSPDKSETCLHPTAVKAGGMRIVQDKTHLKKKTETPVPKPEEEVLKVSTSPPKQVDLLSGACSKGNADFSPAAVKAFHDKPAPTHDSQYSHKPTVIQQPRK